MSHLPVIVGIGGVNAAGRTSFHHGYKRLVIDRLNEKERQNTVLSLASLMGLLSEKEGTFFNANGEKIPADEIEKRFLNDIRNNTLLRHIIPDLFDADGVEINNRVTVSSSPEQRIRFTLPAKSLPQHTPENWDIWEIPGDDQVVEVSINGSLEFYLPDRKQASVKTAGQLPTGFSPGAHYHSVNHPRGLQMAVFSACDAIGSLGIDWETVRQAVHPDHIGVYAGSGHGQMDDSGGGGLMKALALGKRTSSRFLPLSLIDMPSNFINAYIIGNVGHTGTQMGACATFLYNLELAMKEIRMGKRRVAIVGNSEAPVIPEIMEGYRAMGALADENRLAAASKTGRVEHEDRLKSCRPFSENFGFTLSESSQYVILFDDDLAVELGAEVLGSLADIFIKADGFKKSISSPGFGNYITLAKAAAQARSILGEASLRRGSYVSAHGSGTPLNRITESHGLNETARTFGIEKWQIAAIKCYLGHPLTPASGDQLMAALGTWQYGLIPGIFTLYAIPDDVHRSNLRFDREHVEIDPRGMDSVLINSKGFGGNNSTGLVFSPHVTLKMMEQKHGADAMKRYHRKNETVREQAAEYDKEATVGRFNVYYKDSEPLLDENDLDLTDQRLRIRGYGKSVDLNLENPFPDMSPFRPE